MAPSAFVNHYENMPMQYTEVFKVVKNGNFHQKNFDIFLIFQCSKHRLWVLVRTASAHFLSKNKKNIKKFPLKLFSFYNFKINVYCMGMFS